MYESFFGLRELPFSLTPDPRFLWLSETHEEGLAALCYGITRRKGFILLTGEVGAGKTTLLRAALERIPAGTETALILNTADLSPVDLLKLIAAEFGLVVEAATKADILIALNRFLLERLTDGLNTVLVIDEAQNLSMSALEEVRLLSNLETDTAKLLQIVLTGQPELRDKLAAYELRQLRQRIAIEHHVEALRPDEVEPYLRHRIEVAGGKYEQVFEPGVESIFYGASLGCPRLISLVADRSLLAAFSRQRAPVPREIVEQKAAQVANATRPAAPAATENRHG
ncbi:MAG: AAA family ATPase [Myxococcota bacterium]|jgi:general secretion pathway protein A|nr:AAA family ATPase [Myxococcota bacterium]